MSKQLLKSATAIGALIREAEIAQSQADFLHKMNIALKEANETDYWLNLLKDGQYLSNQKFTILHSQLDELLKMLVSSVRTVKKNLGR